MRLRIARRAPRSRRRSERRTPRVIASWHRSRSLLKQAPATSNALKDDGYGPASDYRELIPMHLRSLWPVSGLEPSGGTWPKPRRRAGIARSKQGPEKRLAAPCRGRCRVKRRRRRQRRSDRRSVRWAESVKRAHEIEVCAPEKAPEPLG